MILGNQKVSNERATWISLYLQFHFILMFLEELTRLDLEFKMSRGDVFNQNGSCDCLPSCTSITYNTEISQNMENNTPSNEYYFTQLNMRFRDGNFLVLERDALFSNTDFWASCGGLFGLFTGFSVMSLVEIIYFLFFRWICNLRNLSIF
jgi:amiloride-sensitive sodium channel